jgi:toxin ParE1/3/4
VRLRYTRRASRQLDAILSYISEQSPKGAANVADRIRAMIDLLTTQANMGRPTNRTGFRRIVAHPYPYVILYRATEDEIIVHAVRHGARRPPRW